MLLNSLTRIGFCVGSLAAFTAVSLLLKPVHADAPPAATAIPDYSNFSQSYHMPFGNKKVDFDDLRSMDVRMSINGGPPMLFQVDTGSTGVIVGADLVSHIDTNAPPGSITYSSSGVELDGVWTSATLTFPDCKDSEGHVATALVPILAVNERKLHAGTVNGVTTVPVKPTTKSNKPPHPFMLGIGSGRGVETHQERNPWVNLREMQAGTMRRGYTIGRDGVTLGLTPNVVKDFQFVKLTEHLGKPTTQPEPPYVHPAPKDWNSSPGWVTLDGKDIDKPSGMLLDTGLTNFMIEVPDAKAQADVPAGSDVVVHLLDGKLQYSYKVGDTKNPNAPRKTTWVIRPAGPLINTGLRALASFDYLYDADGGYMGLRPTR